MEVIAHRGASAYAPENTLAAFDLALALGADTIELDVRRAADGELVIVHDPPGPGRHALPTLDAVFDRYGRRTRYLVDVKDPDPSWEAEVVRTIDRHDVGRCCTLQSFDVDGLVRLERLAPQIPYVLLYRRAASAFIDLGAVPGFVAGIGPWHRTVTASLVTRARGRGLSVRPWTVDAPAEARRLHGLGVRHVITNAPDVIAATVGGSGASGLAVAV